MSAFLIRRGAVVNDRYQLFRCGLVKSSSLDQEAVQTSRTSTIRTEKTAESAETAKQRFFADRRRALRGYLPTYSTYLTYPTYLTYSTYPTYLPSLPHPPLFRTAP